MLCSSFWCPAHTPPATEFKVLSNRSSWSFLGKLSIRASNFRLIVLLSIRQIKFPTPNSVMLPAWSIFLLPFYLSQSCFPSKTLLKFYFFQNLLSTIPLCLLHYSFACIYQYLLMCIILIFPSRQLILKEKCEFTFKKMSSSINLPMGNYS